MKTNWKKLETNWKIWTKWWPTVKKMKTNWKKLRLTEKIKTNWKKLRLTEKKNED